MRRRKEGLNVRILRKISTRVRIIENDKGIYEVQHKPCLLTKRQASKVDWEILNQFQRYNKAADRKNNYIVMILMRDMGYRNELVRRRTERKKIRDVRRRKNYQRA